MKTLIKPLADNRVFLRFDCLLSGNTREVTIEAPVHGGYVYFDNGGQVCEYLHNKGVTLRWPCSEPLVHMIRKEFRKMRNLQKRAIGDA